MLIKTTAELSKVMEESHIVEIRMAKLTSNLLDQIFPDLGPSEACSTMKEKIKELEQRYEEFKAIYAKLSNSDPLFMATISTLRLTKQKLFVKVKYQGQTYKRMLNLKKYNIPVVMMVTQFLKEIDDEANNESND